jgi:hypothetical protein
MFKNLGHDLRWFGEKTTTAASWLGHKVRGASTAISPVVAHFNLVLGAGEASVGMVMKEVGALGDARKAIMRGGYFSLQAIQRTVNGKRNDAGAFWSAYSTIRGLDNPLERGR